MSLISELQESLSGLVVLPSVRTADSIVSQLKTATSRSLGILDGHYDEAVIFSMVWGQDNTGGSDDCDVFLASMQKLPYVRKDLCGKFAIEDDMSAMKIVQSISTLVYSMDEKKRRLLILHYAGHGTTNSTSANLVLVPKITDEPSSDEKKGPYVDFSVIKNVLFSEAGRGLDVLMVMDCCCAAVGAGRGGYKNGRVEFVAAAPMTGISNSRHDGQTFTQAWCDAFDLLFEKEKPFGTQDIINKLSEVRNKKLGQFSHLYVLQEGSALQITYHPASEALQESSVRDVQLKAVVVVYHAEEAVLDVQSIAEEIARQKLPAKYLGAVAVDSSLVILEMPDIVAELLPGIGKYCIPLFASKHIAYYRHGALITN